TGATSTSEKFKDYADQLVAAAEEGNTDTIEVDNQE
ncbi:MAG TPA: FMN-binding protein, partial [Atopostipes sp.]|nr:FMN-binding protein [Atopostipes sp.]